MRNMMLWLALFVATPAVAQDVVEEGYSAAPTQIDVAPPRRVEVDPIYPRGTQDARGQAETVCFFDVTIDTGGAPIEVGTTAGCPDDFYDSGLKAFSASRWEPAHIEGVPYIAHFSERVRWRVRSSARPDWTVEALQDRIDAHAVLGGSKDVCRIEMSVTPKHSLIDLASNDAPDCMALEEGKLRNPWWLRRKMTAPVTCTATLTSDLGNTTGLSVDRSGTCDEKHARKLEKWQSKWVYNTVEEEEKVPYEVQVTFLK